MNSGRSNRNFIIVAAVVAALALAYGIANFRKAFPEIAIDFKANKPQALSSAQDWLTSRGLDLAGYKRVITFDYDGNTKVYLERELGVDRAVSLTRDSIDCWRWEARFFKPLQKLEYSVNLSPAGQVIGFQRKLLEDAAGPKLEPDAARALSEAFITGPMAMDLSQWNLIESGAEDRPDRRDHTFTYELKDFKAKDATYRMDVGVQGAEVGKFRRFLKVPQIWEREYDRQRQQNMLFQFIDQFFFLLLIIGIVVVFVRQIRARQVYWKMSLWMGGVLTALLFVMMVNTLPLTMAGYDTTDSYSAHFGKWLVLGLLGAGLQGALVLLFIGSGEKLYRDDHPDKLFIGSIFTRRGFRSREIIQGTLMGYILAAFHIGFVVLFYVLGYKIGVWAPAEVKYTDAVSTLAPWIYPLAISMMAAMSEEFMFRLFGISFLRRLFKSTWLAVVVQALIWGFAHSSYPQQPGFVRGIEVGIIGIVAGFVMLRFGIWATLVWHFTIDAIFIGLFLFQSSNAYFWVSGLIVCSALAIPAVVAGIVYLRRRGLEQADDLMNKAVSGPARLELKAEPAAGMSPAPVTPGKPVTSEPVHAGWLSLRARKAALVVGVAGMLLTLAPDSRKFGEDVYPKIDRKGALKAAGEALKLKYGENAADYKTTATIGSVSNSFVKRNCGLDEAEKIILSPDGSSKPNWDVVFKREFDPVEYWTQIQVANGDVSIQRILADTSSGANLTSDSAKVLAEVAFKEAEPLPENYKLIEERSEKKDNRTDHFFIWELVNPVIKDSVYGDAHYRRDVIIQGEDIQPNYRWLKVPEKWQRHEKEKGWLWTVNLALIMLLVIGGVVLSFATFRKRIPRKEVNWSGAIKVGIVMAVVSTLARLNEWPSIWMHYQTSQSVSAFSVIMFIGLLSGSLLAGLFATLAIALADAFLRGRFNRPLFRLPGRDEKGDWDTGIVAIFGICGAMLGLNWLLDGLAGWFNLPVHAYELKLPEGLENYLPWAAYLLKGITRILFVTPLLWLGYLLLEHGIRRGWLRWLAMAVLAATLSGLVAIGGQHLTTGEYLWKAVQVFAKVALVYLILRYWVQAHLWTAMAAWFILTVLTAGVTFLGWTYSPYPPQGWLLAGIGAVTIAYLLWRCLAKGEKVRM